MTVQDAIDMLSNVDRKRELMWHDAIEGNDCPVSSFFWYLGKDDDNCVYCTPCSVDKVQEQCGKVKVGGMEYMGKIPKDVLDKL